MVINAIEMINKPKGGLLKEILEIFSPLSVIFSTVKLECLWM